MEWEHLGFTLHLGANSTTLPHLNHGLLSRTPRRLQLIQKYHSGKVAKSSIPCQGRNLIKHRLYWEKKGPAGMSLTYTCNEHVLQEMVNVIIAEVDPEQIILFGSRARGEARPDSDVDLLVIEREPFGKTGADEKKPFDYGEPWHISEFPKIFWCIPMKK